MKCDECNGTGYVAIAPEIRGIRKCSMCNGTEEIPTTSQQNELSMSDNEELCSTLKSLKSLLTGCSIDTADDIEYVATKLIDAGVSIIKDCYEEV